VRVEGLLDAALDRLFATFGGVDLFATPQEKVTAVMYGIITGHPFIDGNKRTGYALARLVLQDAGLDIQANEEKKYDMVILIATGKLDVDGVRAWLEPRVVKST